MFDWDDENREHIARHSVTPEEAEQALTIAPVDVMAQYYDDEERFLQLGVTSNLRVLAIVTTWRGDLIRVITAFSASAALQEKYWKKRRELYGD